MKYFVESDKENNYTVDEFIHEEILLGTNKLFLCLKITDFKNLTLFKCKISPDNYQIKKLFCTKYEQVNN